MIFHLWGDIWNIVILITGASSGIGRAAAVALGRHNNKMIVTARREALLNETADQIRYEGSECLCFAGDATESSHAQEVVENIIDRYGRIDIAILNVGIGPPSNAITASSEQILFYMRTNFDSMVNFYAPIMAQMKKQDAPCMISHMNSQASYFGIPMQGDYTASKGAARLFLETARMELKHFGYKHIMIQTIHPGFVDTEAVRNDGIPAPNEISEEAAARYILKGIKKEKKENMFPPSMAFAVRFGRIAPLWLKTKALLAETPKEY